MTKITMPLLKFYYERSKHLAEKENLNYIQRMEKCCDEAGCKCGRLSLWERLGFVTNKKLCKLIRKLMEQIAEVQADLDAANATLAAMGPIVSNIAADVTNLQNQIAALVAGQVTQAEIDALKAGGASLKDNLASMSSALTAVDEQTPPL